MIEGIYLLCWVLCSTAGMVVDWRKGQMNPNHIGINFVAGLIWPLVLVGLGVYWGFRLWEERND